MQLGSRVKELCRERNISVAKIERMAGIPEKSISKWDTNIPSFDKVERVVNALGISFDEFTENGTAHVELDMPRSWYNTIKAGAHICKESVNDFIERSALNYALNLIDAEDREEEGPRDLRGQTEKPQQTASVPAPSIFKSIKDKLS